MRGSLSLWQRAVSLLDQPARRDIRTVILISCLSAGASSAMIGSLMPFLTVLLNSDAIETSQVLSRLYDLSGVDSRHAFLTLLGITSIALLLIAAGLRILNTYALAKFNSTQVRNMGSRLLRQYLHRPYSFHIGRNSADLSANLLSEAGEAVRYVFRPAIQLVSSILTSLAVITVLASINGMVTLVALLVIGGAYGGTYHATRRSIVKLGARRVTANKRLYQAADESLKGIKEIIVLGREAHYLSTFNTASHDVQNASMRVQVLADVPRYLIQTLIFISIILFSLAFVSEEVLRGTGATADLVPLLGVFAAAGQRLVPELQKIYESLSKLRFGASAVDRLYEDMRDSVATENPESRPIRLRKTLELRDVSYCYPGAPTPSLDKISVKISAGERIGIAGVSGVGKTTLGDVVLGLLPPTSGKLLVDGMPITGTAVRAWQKSVGFVPQDIFLADASVAENIALGIGKDEIDMDRVMECCEIAQVTDFVQDLSDGFGTIIGERGVRLSGGQRQRIAIARAIFKGVDLLIFDEATSALDTLTERQVMSALYRLPGEMTVILIAHRLTTLEMCDRILVLEKGRTVGFGDRSEIESCDAYRRLSELAVDD